MTTDHTAPDLKYPQMTPEKRRARYIQDMTYGQAFHRKEAQVFLWEGLIDIYASHLPPEERAALVLMIMTPDERGTSALHAPEMTAEDRVAFAFALLKPRR